MRTYTFDEIKVRNLFFAICDNELMVCKLPISKIKMTPIQNARKSITVVKPGNCSSFEK